MRAVPDKESPSPFLLRAGGQCSQGSISAIHCSQC